MNKWLALALTFNSHTSSSLPYWKSEFEGLFIFTPRWGVHVRERDMIHRWGHGTADINMILIWCAWDRAEVMKEIKAMKRVRTWDSVHYYRTTAEKHGAGTIPPDWTWPLMHRQNPQRHSLEVQTFKMCYFLKGGWSNKYAILPQG